MNTNVLIDLFSASECKGYSTPQTITALRENGSFLVYEPCLYLAQLFVFEPVRALLSCPAAASKGKHCPSSVCEVDSAPL